jgi:lipoic acid synthetase
MTGTGKRTKRPPWLKVPLARAEVVARLKPLLADGSHTICENARCPNLGECWEKGTASFLILGNRCTRKCRYCNVANGSPSKPDSGEPEKLRHIVRKLGMQYVVITSVSRDDLPDGGAESFRKVIIALKELPGVKVEVLTPDFKGDRAAIATVLKGGPHVYAHNLETVERLFPEIRPAGNYRRSLRHLKAIKGCKPDQASKSGIMVGLGETWAELLRAIQDLRQAGVDILSIGQYLQPSRDLVGVKKIYTPDAFAELKLYAERLGFKKVFSGPLVRSSFRAEEGLPA